MFIKFAELPVFDQDRALTFYAKNFSCTVVADSPYGQDDWRWVELALPGGQTHLHFNRRADDVPSEQPVLVFVAEDLEETVEKLRAGRVEIITEPTEAPWEKGTLYAEFRDSEANRIVISQK